MCVVNEPVHRYMKTDLFCCGLVNGHRHGQLNYEVPYGCFFFEKNNCKISQGKLAIWRTYGHDRFATLGWGKRIHRHECYAR
ncbi:predicted protein [Plenodomus lingam JN3]|uniref:Predicted protein n=1 Tax=Leptosphaeria maculans (strain JN3 / isolate v23.1.3 / race Av1-4-5-6-7-8) TaxID=985895 RepID=E5AF94_LEPMJ|nr:predicted protein [Plenodomus lingam JN3]CBY01883.1 predicted protein [Plenodomus lingam JN3]